MRKEWQHGSARGQMQTLPAVEKFHVRHRPTRYSTLIPASRMTFSHFVFSLAIKLPNSAGEPAKTFSPQSAIVCLILGSARPALIDLLSASIRAEGVSFGARTPNQPTD